MSERIPQSVTKRVPLLAFLSSDHLTPATGKTIAVTISKNGASFANPSGGATNATEIGSGWYYVDLSTTDTGATGPLIILGTAGTIDNVTIAYTVADAHNGGFDGVPAVAAGATNGLPLAVDSSGRVDVLKINGTSQTARDIGASVLLSSGTGTGQLSLSTGKVALTSTEHAAITDDVWDATQSSHTTSGTTGASLNSAGSSGSDPWNTALPGSYAPGTAGYELGHNLDAQVSAVKAKTDNIPASPAAVSDIPTATQNADALLKRDLSAVSGEAARSMLNVARLSGINKLVTSGSVLTAYKENDSTPAFTRTLATDGAALPIISTTP